VTAPGRRDLKSLLLSEIQEQLRALGEPSYRTGQIIGWLYGKRAKAIDEMTDLPQSLRTRLAETFSMGKIELVRVLGSRDSTRKFLFRLADGNLIESVLIPASSALYGEPSDRRTICVSTQVGCAYGCKFCASGWKVFLATCLRTKLLIN
jgi:23S rRNA (adenine2503-C2)-methyltransferase